MIDPADSLTQPLSVTIPVPIRVVIDMQQQIIEAALVQDLLGDWFLTQKITGKSTSGKLLAQSRQRSTLVNNQDEGVLMLDALVKQHEKAGGKLRSNLACVPPVC
jgi:hypothetical protein